MSLTPSSLIEDVKAILIENERLAISTSLVMRLTMSTSPGKEVSTSLVNSCLILGLGAFVKKMIPSTVPALGSVRRW